MGVFFCLFVSLTSVPLFWKTTSSPFHVVYLTTELEFLLVVPENLNFQKHLRSFLCTVKAEKLCSRR